MYLLGMYLLGVYLLGVYLLGVYLHNYEQHYQITHFIGTIAKVSIVLRIPVLVLASSQTEWNHWRELIGGLLFN